MSEVAAAHVTPPDVGRSIGFLGGGHMGRALVAALRGAGVAGSRIIVFDTQAATRDALQGDFGIRVADDASATSPRLTCWCWPSNLKIWPRPCAR